MLCLIIIVGPTVEYRRETLYITSTKTIGLLAQYFKFTARYGFDSSFINKVTIWLLRSENSSPKEGQVRLTSKRQHLTKIFANRGRKSNIMCYHISSSSSLTHTWVKIRERVAPHSHILNTQSRVAVVSYLHEKYHKSGGRFKLDFMKAGHVFIGYNPKIMTVYVRKASTK